MAETPAQEGEEMNPEVKEALTDIIRKARPENEKDTYHQRAESIVKRIEEEIGNFVLLPETYEELVNIHGETKMKFSLMADGALFFEGTTEGGDRIEVMLRTEKYDNYHVCNIVPWRSTKLSELESSYPNFHYCSASVYQAIFSRGKS